MKSIKVLTALILLAFSVSCAGDPSPSPGLILQFQMPIEDVFFIKGKGVVVAGRIEQGFVHNHQIVEVVRDGRVIHAVKVGRIESFRTELQTAQQGDDVGILLPGLDQSQVLRGDMLRR